MRRAGHTEAAVDLARLAGLIPAGVLCEVLDGVGRASRDRLHEIAARFHLPILPIETLIRYRRRREKLVERVADAELPTHYGKGRIIGYRVEFEPGNEPVAFVVGDLKSVEAPLVRMHSSCFTGDLLDSLRCDCGDQLHLALEMIGREGVGALIYLPQEGRDRSHRESQGVRASRSGHGHRRGEPRARISRRSARLRRRPPNSSRPRLDQGSPADQQSQESSTRSYCTATAWKWSIKCRSSRPTSRNGRAISPLNATGLAISFRQPSAPMT